MWIGMLVAGFIVFLFGLFLDIVLLPFGFAFTVAGIIIMVLSFFLKPPEPPEPSKPGYKFCWFCLNEIPVDVDRCPVCFMRQKERS